MATGNALAGGRFRALAHKLAWGTRSVGIGHTVVGVTRLLKLQARRPDIAEVRLRSGGTVSFANPSQRVPALVVFGDVIDPELRLIRKVLRPGAVVIDVGAAIGQFTIICGQTPDTTVHAYEPSSSNVASLTRNIAINGLGGRVTIHQVALSTYEGTAPFRTTDNTYLSGLATGDQATEQVVVRRLSDELSRLQLRHVDVLKVNVAGNEADVLRGCHEPLAAGAVSILIVLVGSSVVPALREIDALGYRLFFYDPYAHQLHELNDVNEMELRRPPTPARHVIAVHRTAMETGPLSLIPVRAARNGHA